MSHLLIRVRRPGLHERWSGVGAAHRAWAELRSGRRAGAGNRRCEAADVRATLGPAAGAVRCGASGAARHSCRSAQGVGVEAEPGACRLAMQPAGDLHRTLGLRGTSGHRHL
jgi:hypothetical protein